jgi:hypothetical protein
VVLRMSPGGDPLEGVHSWGSLLGVPLGVSFKLSPEGVPWRLPLDGVSCIGFHGRVPPGCPL